MAISIVELCIESPQDLESAVKKNNEGKNEYWFDSKGHLAVGTTSRYILQLLFSADNLKDGKTAIPLLKGINERLSIPNLKYPTMDGDYDYETIFQAVCSTATRRLPPDD